MFQEGVAPPAIRIIVVDDDALARRGITLLLRALPQTVLLGEAENAEDALRIIRQLKPDVVLSDVRMPGHSGFRLAAAVRAELPDTRVILVSALDDKDMLQRAQAVGAEYVSKTWAVRNLPQLVIGEPVISSQGPTEKPPMLTNREIEIVRLIAAGYRNGEIAEQLQLSVNTVKTYVSRAMAKLGVESRVQLANSAMFFRS